MNQDANSTKTLTIETRPRSIFINAFLGGFCIGVAVGIGIVILIGPL